MLYWLSELSSPCTLVCTVRTCVMLQRAGNSSLRNWRHIWSCGFFLAKGWNVGQTRSEVSLPLFVDWWVWPPLVGNQGHIRVVRSPSRCRNSFEIFSEEFVEMVEQIYGQVCWCFLLKFQHILYNNTVSESSLKNYQMSYYIISSTWGELLCQTSQCLHSGVRRDLST